MSNGVILNYMKPTYPQQPRFNPSCGVNEVYKTLPNPWPWESSIAGPTSMKHIYTGIPNYYPPMRINRPVGTLYDADFSLIGPYGKRYSYTSKMYPLTDRYAREVREYADYMLPYMEPEQSTVLPVTRDTSLNLPLNALPSETQARTSLINTFDNVPKVRPMNYVRRSI